MAESAPGCAFERNQLSPPGAAVRAISEAVERHAECAPSPAVLCGGRRHMRDMVLHAHARQGVGVARGDEIGMQVGRRAFRLDGQDRDQMRDCLFAETDRAAIVEIADML